MYRPSKKLEYEHRAMVAELLRRVAKHHVASDTRPSLTEPGVRSSTMVEASPESCSSDMPANTFSLHIALENGAPVGDTLVDSKFAETDALPGFQKVKPQVYAGLFPVSADDFEDFREALEKLKLNDASLMYEPETSDALGFGFRCGFLGMLHMEIIQERIRREYDLDVISTYPSVVYHVTKTDGRRA